MDSQPQEPMTLHFLGNILTFRARSVATGGSFTVIEVRTAPGAGAPPHTQTDEEAFLILEGGYEITRDGQVRSCRPGDFVHVPPGVVHAFRNPTDAVSKMLLINFPGDLHETFFTLVGDMLPPNSTDFPPPAAPDIPHILASGRSCGIEILAA